MKFDENKPPLYIVMCIQFPRIMTEVAKATMLGHEKYKEADVDYKNFLNVDEIRLLNGAFRHLQKPWDVNEEDGDLLHIVHAVWSLLAAAEKHLYEKEKRRLSWKEELKEVWHEVKRIF